MNKFYNTNNFFDDILPFADNSNRESTDKYILDTLLSRLNNYDINDFICRVSALNLIPYNQNKCAIFDKLIDHVLMSANPLSPSLNKMSPKKFKDLIETGMNLNLAMGIDPIEMPFIQRIKFYGNKWIFSGINSAPAYILQNFIDVLHKYEKRFDPNFILQVNQIIHFVLEISTQIVERVGYSSDVYEHHEKQEIVFLSQSELNKLSQAITFEETDFLNVMDDNFRCNIYFDKKRLMDIEKAEDNYAFYYCPFLKIDSNHFIVLNPSMLVPFTIYNILAISNDFGIKKEIVDLYNEKTWFECQRSLKNLGHKKIDSASLGLELINTDNYKETVYTAFNDGVLFVRLFCDNTDDYSFSNMFSTTSIPVEDIENRWKEIIDSNSIIKKEKFYQLTIINSLGRGVLLPFNQPTCPRNMVLTPFELSCIATNEQNHPNFIAHYIDSKQRLGKHTPLYAEEINYVALYVENEYSFYLGDDYDTRKANIFAGPGDSVDYINKALVETNVQLADFPGSEYLREIIFNEPERNIYCATSLTDFSLMNRFKNLDIWVSGERPGSTEELNILRSVLDLITYWFSECVTIIDRNIFFAKSILIKNHFTGNIQDYYIEKDLADKKITSYLSAEQENETFHIYWKPEAFLCFVNNENVAEKELIRWLLCNISAMVVGDFDLSGFDDLFDNPLKTKMFSLDYMDHPYLKPMIETIRHIPAEFEHKLLDEIGYYFLYNKKYEYGIMKNPEKHQICNDIVSFLYKKLQSEVKKFSPIGFYDSLCFDLECAIYSMMLTQKRYAYDVACYPERASKIDSEFNEINKTSIAAKFLLEYIAAIPPSGNTVLGEGDYEYMLTICSLIIEWAHNSDMFKYKMIDNDLEMLKSGRIGLKKDSIDRLAASNYAASRKRLNAISNPVINLYSPKNLVSNEDLDVAFKDEYSYSFSELCNCVFVLIEIGDTINSDVKRISSKLAYQKIAERCNLCVDVVKKIIDDISLTKRENYLKPPAPYTAFDVYPWRFNRKLSFIRRPITQAENDLIWGNRQLYHSLRFLYDLILDSKLSTKKGGKLESYLGKLINKRGNDFNDVVAKKLKTYDSLIVASKVKKINGHRIMSEQNNDLGDIDVLVIVPSKKKIIVIEVKDFSFAKTPYEMYQQYLSVFVDDEKELCYMSRHHKRVDWVKNHITDVLKNYNLSGDGWKVTEALVVDESIVCNDFYHKDQKIILYSELTKQIVEKI